MLSFGSMDLMSIRDSILLLYVSFCYYGWDSECWWWSVDGRKWWTRIRL